MYNSNAKSVILPSSACASKTFGEGKEVKKKGAEPTESDDQNRVFIDCGGSQARGAPREVALHSWTPSRLLNARQEKIKKSLACGASKIK